MHTVGARAPLGPGEPVPGPTTGGPGSCWCDGQQELVLCGYPGGLGTRCGGAAASIRYSGDNNEGGSNPTICTTIVIIAVDCLTVR